MATNARIGWPGAAAALLAATPVAAQQVSCAKLDQIAAASPGNFRAVAGPDKWGNAADDDLTPTVFLPGAKTCYLDVEYGTFTCVFTTGTTLQGSANGGMDSLATRVGLFQKWFAGCAGATGYINHRRILYAGRYPLRLGVSLYWDKGEFIAAINKEDGE